MLQNQFKNMNALIKRIFDISLSSLGLLFLSPLFLIISIVIKITMLDGPILFKQIRIGRYGKKFTLIKFRSMYVSNEKSKISVLEDKTRISSFGSFLRKYKLDEFPELWNVLIGDMSFVGPRPDVPGYADKLEGEDKKILLLRPGITGPASIKYANEEKMLSNVDDPKNYNDEIVYPDKVKINIEYYENNTLYTDLIIIFKTVFRINY